MPPRHPLCTTWMVLVAVTWLWPASGQTNNTVNGTDGSIVWGELAPDQPYQTADYSADDGGLDPYYALAVSFIDTTLPALLPVATAKDIIDGKTNIGDTWQDLAKQFVGYAVCVVIGFLFILIFPIVGCCFCCCRCCGNCGGKRIHHQGPNDRCKRIAFSIALSLLSLFVLTGAVCVYVTSDRVHQNLGGLNDSFSDAVDDLNTFADNVDNQFRRLGDTNFRFLSDVLKDYVNTASTKVSEDLVSEINSLVNLDTPLNTISALSSSALAEVSQLESQVDTLETQRDTAVTQLTDLNNSCSNCLNGRFTYLNNLPLAGMKTQISDFKDKVSTDVFDEMKKDLDAAIKAKVDNATTGVDIGGELDKVYNDSIKGMLDQVPSFKTKLNDQASDYQKRVEDMVDLIKPYDTYRWYAGVGLASLLGLMAVMMLLGVMLGCCCGSADDRPTERGAASNCGGICLMASVGLVLIFGALLMLLCTLMYMTGALIERYACQTVDHLDRLEQYADSFDLGINLSNYTLDVGGETVSLSVSQFMSDCQEGKTLYTALGLDPIINKAVDKINEQKTDLGSISNNIDADGTASAADGSVDVSAAISNLESTVTSIDDVKKSVVNMKTGLQAEQTAAETDRPGAGAHYNDMITTLTSMETTCDSLKTIATDIKNAAISLNNTELPNAKTTLKNSTAMKTLINKVMGGFVNTTFGFVDSYVGDIKLKLATDVGKCTPFYSIINAILNEAVCHGFVDPLNGFWLALGWCLFFFMPSLVLAVKLAKHFRTMQFDDTYDATPGTKSPPPYYTEASVPPKATLFPPISGPNNKVAPF